MNRRHAAALFLLGWYLMAPPFDPKGNVIEDAPLAKWEILGSFDGADKCGVSRDVFRERLRGEAQDLEAELDAKIPAGEFKSEDEAKEAGLATAAETHPLQVRFQEVVCVSTDDPRLKPQSRTPSPAN
jgi:hypothetical protein